MGFTAHIRQAQTALPRTSLADLNAVQLMRRFDSKYVIPESWLSELILALSEDMHILEVEGQWDCRYQNVYYEFPDDQFLTDHLRGKARRMKIRTRSYGTNGLAFLEVKQRFPGGKTVKQRILRSEGEGLSFAQNELDFLRAFVAKPEMLEPRLEGAFQRLTLVDFKKSERITLDRSLSSNLIAQPPSALMQGLAVVEIKQTRPDRYGPAQQWFRSKTERRGLIARETSVSKYTVARLSCDDRIAGRTYLATHRRLQEACSWAKDLQAQSRP
jgi:hypothetical protein